MPAPADSRFSAWARTHCKRISMALRCRPTAWRTRTYWRSPKCCAIETRALSRSHRPRAEIQFTRVMKPGAATTPSSRSSPKRRSGRSFTMRSGWSTPTQLPHQRDWSGSTLAMNAGCASMVQGANVRTWFSFTLEHWSLYDEPGVEPRHAGHPWRTSSRSCPTPAFASKCATSTRCSCPSAAPRYPRV